MTIERSAQFGQLPMLMSARELKEDIHPRDSGLYRSKEDMWDHKRRQNAPVTGYYAVRNYGVDVGDVRRNGVTEPVTVLHEEKDWPELIDGHHRVIAAYDADPSMLVPVRHVETETAGVK